eukprot:TRINITY_DN21_c0_g1_i1.p1 TRINITY_DN21_c0_g1~~TRINITY_DN21_c0_g1_i1.p1  ORF type:complete len:202 (-),score=58.65 TRINITY_DN21_c0_g1_i1:66-671(-)
MGISRDSVHKRRATGGRRIRLRMKRQFELGRQPAGTKIGDKKINRLRVRGGNYKFRALRLDQGNFTWSSEATTRKTRLLNVVYNATSNELVRTNTLVKGAVVQIDATPFKQFYLQHYNVDLSKNTNDTKDPKTVSASVRSKWNQRNKNQVLEQGIIDQFANGRIYARISSRPGQSGRCDGYILEGEELAFYVRKLNVKKRK